MISRQLSGFVVWIKLMKINLPNAVSNYTNFYNVLQMRVIATGYTNRKHID